jgi:hypothetical protein
MKNIDRAFEKIEKHNLNVRHVFVPDNKDGDKLEEDIKNWKPSSHLPYGVIIDTDDCRIFEIHTKNLGCYNREMIKIVPSEEWLTDLKTAMKDLEEAKNNKLNIIHEIYKKAKWANEEKTNV